MGNYDSEARSNAYFWRGESYYRKGQYAKAISDFNTYQSVSKRRTSETSLVYYNTGYCYFNLKEYSQALIAFRRYITLENRQNSNMLADTYNRIGDCLFYRRQYVEAETNYQRAAEAFPEAADYSLYQRGFVQGLQKDYSGKIRTLDKLINDCPSSQYIDDALFERGRSYVLLEKYDEAISSFTGLIDNHPQSNLAPKAGVQLGLLYYSNNQMEKSISAYKRVVRDYPGSEEAKVAIQDLKSVYIDLNDISSYAAYLSSLGGEMRLEVSEQDSLTYLAAEKLFTRGGDMTEAQRSLENYVKSYPDGAFSVNANFYLAKIAYDRKDYTEARRLFSLVLNSGNNKFREESLARKSEIEYLAKDYDDALKTFGELALTAESRENIEAAKLGIMRCARHTGRDKETIDAANELLKETKLSPEIQAEARYFRAKANIRSGDSNKAVDDLTALSKDTRTEYGAEAKYMLAQLYFDRKDFSRAEKVLTEFIESGTPHQYWLARGFILMSDIYSEKGDKFQARQYLTSLQRNYKGSEEIDRMIEDRLKKLK
jgi:TolA-binding protein